MISSSKASFFEIQAAGIRCKLCALGASIVSIEVPDRSGSFLNIALSPQNYESGQADPSLAGRTIGPCCGRVRDGRIQIDGNRYQLEQNEGTHHLHGGSKGCAVQIWHAVQLSPAHVRFDLCLPSGQGGYPGVRRLQADYIAVDHGLRLSYTAATNQTTWIDLTNHVYWDLSGRFDGSAMDQRLQIAADRVVFNDPHHLPTGIASARETAFDFSAATSPADQLRRHPKEEQLAIANGFNNAYLLNAEMQKEFGFSARLNSLQSGIEMTMRTDQPAIVFYSGGFLDERTQLRGGGATVSCALALEAQQLPDPFHLPGAAPAMLHPDETWARQILWSFSVK